MSNNTISYNGFYQQFLQPVFTTSFHNQLSPPDSHRMIQLAKRNMPNRSSNFLLRVTGWVPLACCVACSESISPADSVPTILAGNDLIENSAPATVADSNPLFTESPLYLQYPPFDRIRTEHYLPAFERGIAEQVLEIDAIAQQQAAPDFENTIIALELSGQLLNRVSAIFFTLAGTDTNAEMQALEQYLAPMLAAHDDNIVLNNALFARIATLYANRQTLQLQPEQTRLIERYYTDFVRAGASLDVNQQARMREINALLSVLQIQFNQNILDEMNAMAIVVADPDELVGLDATAITTAAAAAESRELPGQYLLPLVNTSGQPVLSSLQNRELRERVQRQSESRGNRGGEFDNRELLTAVLRLRAERAAMLGYASHAAYILADQTAASVDAVNQRLSELLPPAVANVRQEAAALQSLINDSGADHQLAAWDWDFYSERLRATRHESDSNMLRPYLELDNVLQRGVFYAAERLYGISFRERFDLPVYHADVRVFEVFDSVGTTLAIFIADYYARPSKRGGAWNSSYIVQSDLLGAQPIMANHLNVNQPANGEQTLLTVDEVTTLFHEFGHALHAMFSAVEYPYFGGTRVPRDFVEFPSQVNEMWATWPEVLANYAVHYQTGEPMPAELLESVFNAEHFNQGYATTEYLAAAVLDQALHQLSVAAIPAAEQLMSFEEEVLRSAGIDTGIVPPRYRGTYFRHIMGGYAAGYYSYIWSEVLDANTVEWFRENGGLTRENGNRFRSAVLSRGGSEDGLQLFRQFRGRDAEIQPLLERRGLSGPASN